MSGSKSSPSFSAWRAECMAPILFLYPLNIDQTLILLEFLSLVIAIA